jgi:ribosomal protein S18 acetylase RimI-like enzyme
MEIKIRNAAVEDYDVVCRLIDEVDALHRNHLPRIFRKLEGPVREKAFYLGLVAEEDVGLFVAQAGGVLVGFIHVVIEDSPAYPILVPRRFAVVDSIVVAADYRHQGIGRVLMDAAEAWALARGAEAIELNVYAFNTAALTFYHQLGYDTLSRRMLKELKSE